MRIMNKVVLLAGLLALLAMPMVASAAMYTGTVNYVATVTNGTSAPSVFISVLPTGATKGTYLSVPSGSANMIVANALTALSNNLPIQYSVSSGAIVTLYVKSSN